MTKALVSKGSPSSSSAVSRLTKWSHVQGSSKSTGACSSLSLRNTLRAGRLWILAFEHKSPLGSLGWCVIEWPLTLANAILACVRTSSASGGTATTPESPARASSTSLLSGCASGPTPSAGTAWSNAFGQSNPTSRICYTRDFDTVAHEAWVSNTKDQRSPLGLSDERAVTLSNTTAFPQVLTGAHPSALSRPPSFSPNPLRFMGNLRNCCPYAVR
jgi:hypothetical protein